MPQEVKLTVSRFLLSVIVPCYNQGHLLSRCIRSVIEAQVRSLEIIVVDDGSTDDTSAIACSLGDSVRVVRQANGGLSAARNTGIQKSNGKFIYFLDSDDYVKPEAFGEVCNGVLPFTGCDVLYSSWEVVSATEELIRVDRPRLKDNVDPLHQLLAGNAFPVHAALTRRSKLTEAGDFDTSLRGFEDWDMWIRLAQVGARFQQTSATFCAYRQSAGSMSRSHTRMVQSGLSVIRKHRLTHGGRCRECTAVRAEAIHQLRYHLYLNCLRDEIKAARQTQGLMAGITLLTRALWVDPGLARTLLRVRWEMWQRKNFRRSF